MTRLVADSPNITNGDDAHVAVCHEFLARINATGTAAPAAHLIVAGVRGGRER